MKNNKIMTIMEPGRNQSSMFTDQLYIANSILNSEMEIDHLCPRQMNEWLSVHRIGKRAPAVSGGTILLGSSREGENN
jgi:hypothetical protein